jgi:hypothetical protein
MLHLQVQSTTRHNPWFYDNATREAGSSNLHPDWIVFFINLRLRQLIQWSFLGVIISFYVPKPDVKECFLFSHCYASDFFPFTSSSCGQSHPSHYRDQDIPKQVFDEKAFCT